MNSFEDANRSLWDELADVHVKSYGVDKFKAGESTIDDIQLREIGDIRGKTLLHLQCHFGLDTLSLARAGAIVTGVDFSERAIEHARRLQIETGIPARFFHSNVYDLKNVLDEKFDIVYTTQGVLCWLKDLKEWARIIAHFLKPGGILYLMEAHPIITIFDDTKRGKLDIIHNYFHSDQPTIWDDNAPDYSDPTFNWPSVSYEWQWTISDIINSLISAGLTIELFNEYDKTFSKALPDMERDPDGYWVLPQFRGKLPLMFSLRARR
jgi:SAM-dependent methyltransferase